MTMSMRAGSSNDGAIQINGVDIVSLTTAGMAAATGKTLTATMASKVPISTTATTLAIGDVGKCVSISAGITVPNNVFSAGDVVSIFNSTTGNLTITSALSTALWLAGTNGSSHKTLAQKGLATILFISGTEAVVSGAGVS